MVIAINHVVEATASVVPEPGTEAYAAALEHRRPTRGGRLVADFRTGEERVQPKRLHFHGLANSRRDNPITDLRVRPGKLHAGNPGCEQAVVVHADAEARACGVTGQDRCNGLPKSVM